MTIQKDSTMSEINTELPDEYSHYLRCERGEKADSLSLLRGTPHLAAVSARLGFLI